MPDGLTDYPDLLDPSLAGGKIGVPDPAIGPALVDFYLWLEEKFGEEFVADLAAQEPRIYPSSLPIGEALQSGEISAGAFAAPVQLVPATGERRPGRLRDLRGCRRLGRPLLRRHPHVVGQPERGGAARRLHGDGRGPGARPGRQRLGAARHPRHADHQRPGAGSRTSRPRRPSPAAAYVEEWNAMFR